MTPTVDALHILRAHARGLKERAIALERSFTRPATKARASLLVVNISDKMAVLDELTAADPSPSIAALLAEPAERVRQLEALLLADGENAEAPTRIEHRDLGR